MGCLASCESDDVSCSSAFASCRTAHCASSCLKTAQEIEAAVVPLEALAQDVVKKYIEDNLHTALQAHLPSALALHFETVADNALDRVLSLSSVEIHGMPSVPE